MFKELYDLFYRKNINDGNIIKIISDELLIELTPRVLAFWFSDDGAYAGSNLYLHTKGFTPFLFKKGLMKFID